MLKFLFNRIKHVKIKKTDTTFNEETSSHKPKWPLHWVPPKHLRHPKWRYD